MNILLVEDEIRVADFIQRGLNGEGWLVTHLPDGEQALQLLQDETFDLILLDIMLPGISGLDVCRKLRARNNNTPILMLTALDSIDERVTGLKLGADDYLVKPFEFDELIARLQALYRRKHGYDRQLDEPVLVFGDISHDLRTLETEVNGVIVELTKKERDILLMFMSNSNRVFSRERILSTVWSVNEDPMTNVVDVYIGRLRKKLRSKKTKIQTVRGTGYRFCLMSTR